MISNACATMRTAMSFFPLLRPFIIKLLEMTNVQFHREDIRAMLSHLSTNRSTMGICAFLNCFLA